ncbi:Phage-related protein [Mycobacterium tuberculosis]|nr:Phage-related protein [Mycobacterium tuberculosis]
MIAAFVAIGVAVTALAYLIYKNWDSIKAYLSLTWESIRTMAQSVWNAIKEFFVQYWPLLLGVFTLGIGTIVVELVKNWDSITATIRKVWEGIKSFLSSTWNWIKTLASNSFEAIASVLENIWDSVTGTVKGVWDGIVSTIKGAINSIIGAINKFIDGVNSIKITVPTINIPFVGTFGGFTIGMPQIPKIPALATGTNYVPEDMLAYIHKGEAVVPKEYNPAADGGGSTGGTIVIELDGRVIAQKTFERMGGTLRMRGAVT